MWVSPKINQRTNVSLTPCFLVYCFPPSYLLASTNVSTCRIPHIDELEPEEDKLFGDDKCGEIDPRELLRRVVDIRNRAIECKEYKKPEVALGDDVVQLMIELVRDVLWREKDLQVKSIHVECCTSSYGHCQVPYSMFCSVLT